MRFSKSAHWFWPATFVQSWGLSAVTLTLQTVLRGSLGTNHHRLPRLVTKASALRDGSAEGVSAFMVMKRPSARGYQPRLASTRQRRRQVLAFSTLAHRRKERQHLGSLRNNLVKPYTRTLYTKALVWFFNWLDATGLCLPDRVSELDGIVCEAIESAWDVGQPRSLIGNLLSGLPHNVNAVHGRLRGSWRLWQKWGELEIPCRAPPLSLKAILAMAFFFVDWGFRNEALLLCLAFDRFMRTDECLSLTAGQFTFNMRRLEMHIILPKTKTSQRKGRTESLHVTDPLLVRHFKALCRHLEPCDRLLTVSQARFRQLFDAAVAHCGLNMDIKPYSLRRGGATAFFNTHGSYDRAMEVGRWSD